jgi:hypothetical protein
MSRQGEEDAFGRYGGIGDLTCLRFWLQQLRVDTQATLSMASLRATSSTSTMWSSLFATLGTWLRGLLGPSAWPAGNGVTRCPPAEVSYPSSPTPSPLPLPYVVLWPQELKPLNSILTLFWFRQGLLGAEKGHKWELPQLLDISM